MKTPLPLNINKINPAVSRRTFLASGSVFSAALAVAPSLLRDSSAAELSPVSTTKTAVKIPIGLELYSVRGELARNLPVTLQAVAKMGYEVVEFYSPYFGWTFPFAKEIRAQLDGLGMRCLSTHNHIESFKPGDGMAKAIELNQILGARHIVMASAPGGTKGAEGWKKLCEQLTQAVEQMKPHGLTAGFHNHQTEWAKVDGDLRIMDIIAANTPKEFVLQFDVGTCVEAGADPVAWIKANPGRIRSMHLKDWAPGTRAEEKGYRVLFGEGASPWREIIAAAESVGGVECYLLEQEGSRFSEFETAQKCIEAWKTFRKGV
jgi:sugar phosphate isomerase/epimerase